MTNAAWLPAVLLACRHPADFCLISPAMIRAKADERNQVWQQRTERLGLFQEKVGKLRGMIEGKNC